MQHQAHNNHHPLNYASSSITRLIFGKYRIKQRIGEGSFGKIFSAENIITGEDVAVKIEPKEINPSLLEVESYFLCKLKGGKTISTYLLALFHRWNPRD